MQQGHPNRAIVEIGAKFNRLTIIEDLGSILRNGIRHTFVKSRCDCGNEHFAKYAKVKSGAIKSCGCLLRDMAKEWMPKRFKTHGLTKHPLMSVWSGMIQRCTNKKEISYKNYGGNGVLVCEEWMNSFKSFYDWAMANGWERGLQLDKDIKGNGKLYSPETCMFASRKENNRSKRTNVFIEFNGERMCLTDWANRLGIDSGAMVYRLRNWSIEKSLTTPRQEQYVRTKVC